jgi:hypothetical protein
MNMFAAPWRPAQVRLAPVLGQTVSNPPGTMVVPVKPAFIDSPVIQFATDIAATVSMGMLGSSFGKVNSRWSTPFWVASGLAAFKGLYDLSRLNR